MNDTYVYFTENIACNDVPSVNEYLETKLLKDGTTIQDIANSYEEIFYITDDLRIVDEPTKEWVAIKTNRKWGGNPIFFFARYKYSSGIYEGWLLGDFEHASIGLQKTWKFPNSDFYAKYCELENALTNGKVHSKTVVSPIRTVAPSTNPAEGMARDIFDHLLINNWKSVSGLERYLKIIGNRLVELHNEGNTKYFIENSKRYAVVNTGLLNEYKEDVYIIYQYHVGKNMYIPYKIIRSKQDWIENDFSRDVIGKVAPIRFYEGSNFIGHISYEDIDIPDGVFNHILKENKSRIEAIVGDGHSNDFIADRIRESINISIKMLERDPGYVKPSYSTEAGLSWFMPLHIQKSFSEEPEFVMPLVKDGEFYTIKTILPYDDEIKDRFTAVSLYSARW